MTEKDLARIEGLAASRYEENKHRAIEVSMHLEVSIPALCQQVREAMAALANEHVLRGCFPGKCSVCAKLAAYKGEG